MNKEEVKVVLLTQNKNIKYLYGSAFPEKSIIELHGGTITVKKQSRSGNGIQDNIE